MTSSQSDNIIELAEAAGVPVRVVGEAKGDEITVPGESPIKLQRLKDLHEGWLPHYMTSR